MSRHANLRPRLSATCHRSAQQRGKRSAGVMIFYDGFKVRTFFWDQKSRSTSAFAAKLCTWRNNLSRMHCICPLADQCIITPFVLPMIFIYTSEGQKSEGTLLNIRRNKREKYRSHPRLYFLLQLFILASHEVKKLGQLQNQIKVLILIVNNLMPVKREKHSNGTLPNKPNNSLYGREYQKLNSEELIATAKSSEEYNIKQRERKQK